MFGMGVPEVILILAIALVVIGPKKLPGLAKSMGRAFQEFRKATSELKQSMEIDEMDDVKKAFDDMNADVKEATSFSLDSRSDALVDAAPKPGDKKEDSDKADAEKGDFDKPDPDEAMRGENGADDPGPGDAMKSGNGEPASPEAPGKTDEKPGEAERERKDG